MWTSRALRPRLAGLAAGLAVALMATACSSSSTSDAAGGGDGLGTIEPGVLTVAIQPAAPYTEKKGDGMTGLDADIVNEIAARLKLKVKVEVTDFAGMLAGVQSGRYDMTVGGVAWSAERQKSGLFTDPPYYSPPAMAVRSGKTYQTVDDLKGLNLGTVEGYVWVKSIQQVPGAKLHAYPDANGVLDDLGAGRVDVGFLDPLVILAAQQARPELKISTQYLTPPTDQQVSEHPAYDYFRPYMVSFYLPKTATALERAFSAEIGKMYGDGRMTKLAQKYGADPSQFLKPSPGMAELRRNVDRPAGWTPPSI
ncbi:transporter substrate-binding domain-containing protein [Planotetraspora sp. A-T 1434]|uniref:substrate-binding periplasmic protein n=1 Tax=Planotetraspora sp. A-T 1434 TaxID=2979219 RepID=UPI0021C094E8|nr:transporter substrate-binding domain-containing protein [Planotetraspora sp. A-T 1434]MCT9932243.1 transporter substrate-binding domain-containing protein [Planotetraspora sp. A-T 1434]